MLLLVDAFSFRLHMFKVSRSLRSSFSLPAFLLSARLLNNNFRLQSPTFHYEYSKTAVLWATEVAPDDCKEGENRRDNKRDMDLRGNVWWKILTCLSLDLPSCRAVGVGRGGAGQCRLTVIPPSFKVNLDVSFFFFSKNFETCFGATVFLLVFVHSALF